MRYAVAVLAVAGAVLATADEPASTVYSTEYFTITSCAPEVTNCPARSTVVSSSVVAVSTSAEASVTVSGAEPVETAPVVVPPSASGSASITAVPTPSEAVTPSESITETGAAPSVSATGGVAPSVSVTGGVAPSVSVPATLATSATSVCSGITVKTISTSVTTVIPTVIYETVQASCPTSAPSQPSATIPGVPIGGNGTTVSPTKTPVIAGAAGLTGSAMLAAVAGVAAFVFA
ncbi:hypothetical protein CORC01_05978 [Colletotrichum orchidophilum]|uniref:GPI anchored serine-rich protein n=1 Tax=Colletotrichum orchidophilum TaxID=1209926 RepID=A0A1G4BBM7_9PEZI|nr:uncharacterized protein CORC01_05978 [Colletotrichum orchidophilum]OHE98712.1 hypothetical protein CORC01_05978 [Colletotrichum orchidophilum]